jgi:hypothetical protein
MTGLGAIKCFFHAASIRAAEYARHPAGTDAAYPLPIGTRMVPFAARPVEG